MKQAFAVQIQVGGRLHEDGELLDLLVFGASAEDAIKVVESRYGNVIVNVSTPYEGFEADLVLGLPKMNLN